MNQESNGHAVSEMALVDQNLPQNMMTNVSLVRNPEKILEDARRASVSLMTVIKSKKKPVMFNGEQYLEFEDWQTLAGFYGLTSRIVHSQYVEYGQVIGFEAKAEVYHAGSGAILSTAEAMCLNDEDNWSSRPKFAYENGKRVKKGDAPVPLFQLKSMSQTRACAKALRNVLAWVVVMAGFRATPAEEIQEMIDQDPKVPQEESIYKPSAGNPPSSNGQVRMITESQIKLIMVKIKDAGLSKEDLDKHIFSKYGAESVNQLKISDANPLLEWIRGKSRMDREPGIDG